MDGYRTTKSSVKTQSQNPSKPSNFSQPNDNPVHSSNHSMPFKQNSSKPTPKPQSQKLTPTRSTSSKMPTVKPTSSKSQPTQPSVMGSTRPQASSAPSNTSRPSTTAASKGRVEDRERRRSSSTKPEDDKTVKNPELVKTDKAVDNKDLINGLALQRQWDEKPDIDHLSNSLMDLYYRLESSNLQNPSESTESNKNASSKESSDTPESNEEIKELREKIFLSSLRVRSKSVIYLNFTKNKLLSILNFSRSLNLKYRTLKTNVVNIEKSYLAKCRKYQKRRSLNEVYDKLSRVVAKLPNMKQIQLISKELMNKMTRINGKIEKIKAQMELQKSHIQNVTQLLSNVTSINTAS